MPRELWERHTLIKVWRHLDIMDSHVVLFDTIALIKSAKKESEIMIQNNKLYVQ